MKHYELIYIVAGKYAENEVTDISVQVDSLIAKHGGTITFTQYWERKKLAYPIDHISYGHYVISEFDMKPSSIAGFERALRLSADIVRHMIVAKETVGTPLVLEPKPTTPSEEVSSDEVAVVSEKEAPAPTPEPVAVTPVEPTPAKKEVAKKTVETAPEKEEVVDETPDATNDATKAKKKTDNKVSFEDLDKKLDEILNNDII